MSAEIASTELIEKIANLMDDSKASKEAWETTLNTVPEYKERIVALKNDFKLGLDVFETYSPVLRQELQHHFDNLENSYSTDIVLSLLSARASKSGAAEPSTEDIQSFKNTLTSINPDWGKIVATDLIKLAILGEQK